MFKFPQLSPKYILLLIRSNKNPSIRSGSYSPGPCSLLGVYWVSCSMGDTGLFPGAHPLCWCVTLEQRPRPELRARGRDMRGGGMSRGSAQPGSRGSAATFPCSHDFIGEFTTSYRELARGQSQFNIYEVRQTPEGWGLL